MSADRLRLGRARAMALRLLRVRPQASAEIRERLTRAGLAEQSDEILGWLGRLGYLDDSGYARARAKSLLAPGRFGPLWAHSRLLAAGIPEAEAERAIAEALEEGSGKEGGGEAALCRALAEKRLRGSPIRSLDARARAKLWRFLTGRGFSERAVGQVVGGEGDPE